MGLLTFSFGFRHFVLETMHNALVSETLKLHFPEDKIDEFCLMRLKTLEQYYVN